MCKNARKGYIMLDAVFALCIGMIFFTTIGFMLAAANKNISKGRKEKRIEEIFELFSREASGEISILNRGEDGEFYTEIQEIMELDSKSIDEILKEYRDENSQVQLKIQKAEPMVNEVKFSYEERDFIWNGEFYVFRWK